MAALLFQLGFANIIEILSIDTSELEFWNRAGENVMENQIKSKGANTIGPLIQYSCLEFSNEEMNINMSLMIQTDRYINNIDPGFSMKAVIKIPNYMYVRFERNEEDE